MKNIQKNMLIRCTLREKYDENTGIYEYIDIFYVRRHFVSTHLQKIYTWFIQKKMNKTHSNQKS